MKLIEDYILSLMNDSTLDEPIWNIEKIRQGKKSGWDYIDGCMILALLEFYKARGDRKFLEFADEYVGHRVSGDGTIDGYSSAELNIDNINGGKNLLTLYEITGKDKYKKAADRIYHQICNHPRTREGNFWHKLIYPNQVWLDGLYMVMPFYAKYANLFLGTEEKKRAYEDIYRQFFNVEKLMKDAESGLYYHCYDASREMFWCNRQTGLCQNFWLRALGWFSMAMLDTLEILEDKNSNDYKHLLTMFRNFETSVKAYQTESGMWYQLPAYPNRDGNYLETSGSAIFSYSFKKGAKLGFLDESFKAAGEKAFDDIVKRYLTDNDGKLGLGGICLVAGLGGRDRRDGSFEYYMSEPVVKDDAKGTAPFILAYLG